MLHLLVLLTLLPSVPRGVASSSSARVAGPKHIVFFGDSLMRYQYLAYVYRLHFRTSKVPNFMINEKLYGDWNSFFKNSTEVFEGAMTCDCYREASVKRLASARENRRYTHQSGSLVASYFPLMGYFPIQGMNQSAVEKFFGDAVSYPDWSYRSPFTFVQQHMSKLDPPPTVVFVNSGHWNNKQIARNPHLLMARIESVILSGNLIDGISLGSGHDVDSSDKCVAWLATTKPNIAWWPGSRDADWNIIKSKCCPESLDRVNFTKSNEAEKINTMSKDLLISVFVPFRLPVSSGDYFDHMHFSNESIYHARTDLALAACHLSYAIYASH